MTDPKSHNTAAGGSGLPDRLLAATRARRTYLSIYQAYRKATPKADFAALLDRLVEDTQEALALLSHQVRVLGHSPLSTGVNEGLLKQGMDRKGTLSKLNFLLVGSTQSLDWYARQRSPEDPPEIAELWQALIDQETQHQQQIKDLLASVELASGPDKAAEAKDVASARLASRPAKPVRKVRLRRSPGPSARRKRPRP